MSDQPGVVNISTGKGAENTIVLDERNEVLSIKGKKGLGSEEVKSDKLANVMRAHNITEIDFLKVDIEGAEPLMTDDILTIKPKVMFIEFSNKNTLENNLEMLKRLSEFYKCYLNENHELSSYQDIKSHLENVWSAFHSGTVSRSVNLWFVLKAKG